MNTYNVPDAISPSTRFCHEADKNKKEVLTFRNIGVHPVLSTRDTINELVELVLLPCISIPCAQVFLEVSVCFCVDHRSAKCAAAGCTAGVARKLCMTHHRVHRPVCVGVWTGFRVSCT